MAVPLLCSDTRSDNNILGQIIQTILQEHLNAKHCDILSFHQDHELADYGQHKIAKSLKTGYFQARPTYNMPCLLIIIDGSQLSSEDVEWIVETTWKVRRSALLFLNCNDDCLLRHPVNLEKSTFSTFKDKKTGDTILKISCAPQRAPKIMMIWKQSKSPEFYSSKCPFIFSGKSINVTYAVAPSSTLP